MSQQAEKVSHEQRPLPSQAELEDSIASALEQARRNGADAAEATASVDRGLSVKVRRGAVDTLEHQRDRGLALTVYCGQRKGTASTADLGSQAIAEAVEAACQIARYTSEDPYQGLADAERLAREIPDLDLYHPWSLDVDQAIAQARECEQAAFDTDAAVDNSEGAELSSHAAIKVYGNSHGFMGGVQGTSHSLGCAVVARRGDELQRDFWYTVSRQADELEAPASVGRNAAERTVARLGSRRLGTTSAPVLFPPRVARSLFSHFVGAISGGSLYRKSSFLLDALDEKVFAPHVRIEEQPHIPGGLASAPFDAEGVATQPRTLVEDGVLRGYLLSSYAARKLGMATTGNAGGVHNLVVQPGEQGFDELVSGMERGLVVTQLMGQGVNMVTGDYSRGAAGFWVENGAIAYPVEEITIAGSLQEMFAGIEAIGRDVDVQGTIRTGSVLVGGMTIAGE